MLKIFASGVAANMMFVLSGVVKQYLMAGTLSVAGFGVYGSLVALASLLVVLAPFPAYLNVMIRGFSAPPKALGTRKHLLLAVRFEMLTLACMVLVTVVIFILYAAIVEVPDQRVWALPLLLLAQYLMTAADILLRMKQAHKRLSFFMAVRNIPAIVMILVAAPNSPLQIAVIDLVTSLLVVGYFLQVYELRVSGAFRMFHKKLAFTSEQGTLWLARIAQFGNSSLLRLLVPLAYGAQDSGLFFFALIAQLPCSLFLSVATQLYGHTLARLPRGDWSTLLRTQAMFIVPNILYAVLAAVALQYWDDAITYFPKIEKFIDAGPLILAVIFYAAVMASDCQEYLLRSRGYSRILLWFSATSALFQGFCIMLPFQVNIDLQKTIYLCAAVQAIVLTLFSLYSFRRVVGMKTEGMV